MAPTLDSIVAASSLVTSAEDLLSHLWLDQVEIGTLLEEFEQVRGELDAAYVRASLSCPREWAIESSAAQVL